MEYLRLKKNGTDSFVISLDDVISLLVVFLTITSGLAVVHGDSTLSTESIRRVLAYVNLFVSLAVYGICIVTKKLDFTIALVIPIVYLAVCFFDVYEENSFDVISWLRLLLVFLLSPSIRVKALGYYRIVLIVMSILGILGFILYYLHYTELYRIVDYYGVVDGEYVDFGFTYLYRLGSEVRICGLFNEPGYLGTICALILCYEKLDLKKIGNVILLITGFLTFSLAFLLILMIYMAVVGFKKPWYLAIIAVILLLYFLVLPRIEVGGRIGIILDRLRFADGKLVGDNRSNQFVDETLLKVLGESPVWGYGGGYSSATFVAVSTFKTYIIDYGVLGFILIYGPIAVCMLLRYKINIYSLAFLLCFIVSIYQRPSIFNVLYVLVLLGSMETLTEARWKKK